MYSKVNYTIVGIFVILFGAGMVWFAVWPIIKGKSPFNWAWHFGLIPLIFVLPLYLGYAAYSRTSVGPSGGILYPWMISYLPGGSVSNVEEAILERLPKILEPLSQDIGIPLAITGMGMPRPIAMLGLSLVMAVIAFVIGWGLKHANKERVGETR